MEEDEVGLSSKVRNSRSEALYDFVALVSGAAKGARAQKTWTIPLRTA